MMRRISISGLVIVGLMAMGLGLAAPAHAATITASGGQVTLGGLGGGVTAVFCIQGTDPTICAGGSPLQDAQFEVDTDGTYSVGSSVIDLSNGFTTPLPAGTYTVVIRDVGPVLLADQLNVVIGDGGGSSTTSMPQTVDLSINTVDGSTCKQFAESGFAGTWVKLPSADDCTAPSSRAGSTLLGWATNPNFPVDIAQRQVTNGWGAYETFNDEGQLTAVFIPAGGSTYLSGDGNLFAIWSN